MVAKQHPDNQHKQKVPVLDEHSVDRDPFAQFSRWFSDARKSGEPQPEAMFLSTADRHGMPSGRMVLLKRFDRKGFVFFTNYHSRKGAELSENPFAAITFYWKETGSQVRITGKVKKVTNLESDLYFDSRPLENRIGAVISPQSSVISGRSYLEEKYSEFLKKDQPEKFRRPSNWGGFRIDPSEIEFWQERHHRLHDRVRYRKVKRNWIIERLAP